MSGRSNATTIIRLESLKTERHAGACLLQYFTLRIPKGVGIIETIQSKGDVFYA